MNDKIITNIDTNLITYAYQQLSEQAVVQNELLIKELVETIKGNELYSSSENTLKLIQLTKLEKQLQDLFDELEVSNIDEIKRLIIQLDKQITIKENENKQVQLEAEKYQQEQQKKYEDHTQELQAKIEKLEKERDLFERKYLGQKNRKVIRFIDKVAR